MIELTLTNILILMAAATLMINFALVVRVITCTATVAVCTVVLVLIGLMAMFEALWMRFRL